MANTRSKIKARATKTLAIALGGVPPTEFRLFVAGWNETENGRFLFDEVAAVEVMSAYRKWGVDLAIDLEHQMLDEDPSPDPTAKDARGWCNLEVRPDMQGRPELWAVNVRWTEDGAARLTQRRQRYVSPAFAYEVDTKRISSLINVAITAIPATHDTPALMAAKKKLVPSKHAARLAAKGSTMDPKQVQEALDALVAGDEAKCAELLKNIIATAAGGETPPAEEEKDTEDPPADPPAAASAAPAPPVVAAASVARLMRLTSTTTIEDALAAVDTFRESHLELENGRAALAKQQETLDNAERRKVCVELIKLGAEFPSTVWADDNAVALQERWLKMSLASLRAHLTAQRNARKKVATNNATGGITPPPPASSDGAVDQHGLTARELKICTDAKCDPAVFARLKKARQTPNVQA